MPRCGAPQAAEISSKPVHMGNRYEFIGTFVFSFRKLTPIEESRLPEFASSHRAAAASGRTLTTFQLVLTGDPGLFAIARLSLLVRLSAVLFAAFVAVPAGTLWRLRGFPGAKC